MDGGSQNLKYSTNGKGKVNNNDESKWQIFPQSRIGAHYQYYITNTTCLLVCQKKNLDHF